MIKDSEVPKKLQTGWLTMRLMAIFTLSLTANIWLAIECRYYMNAANDATAERLSDAAKHRESIDEMERTQKLLNYQIDRLKTSTASMLEQPKEDAQKIQQLTAEIAVLRKDGRAFDSYKRRMTALTEELDAEVKRLQYMIDHKIDPKSDRKAGNKIDTKPPEPPLQSPQMDHPVCVKKKLDWLEKGDLIRIRGKLGIVVACDPPRSALGATWVKFQDGSQGLYLWDNEMAKASYYGRGYIFEGFYAIKE